MNIITVIDDAGGMCFNSRRQSRDRILRENILRITAGSTLWMNAYSAGQFRTECGRLPANSNSAGQFQERSGDGSIKTDDCFMEKAKAGDFCFVENLLLAPFLDRIDGIWLFRWNRRYPGDFYLDIDVSEKEWVLTESAEFAGSSHERISMEVYVHER